MDWNLGSGGLFGNQGAFGSILGGLGTAATIYGLYNQNKQDQANTSFNQNFQSQQFAEQQRQFGLNYGLQQQQLEQAAGAAAAKLKIAKAQIKAQVQAAHSHAIGGAYDSLIRAVETGRAGEAASLSNIIAAVQRAYSEAH